MIPVSLSIEGLYSYQKRQTIDFQKLTDAQLFGIFGATGSGKSSILEAITLALYNECERLNRNLRNYNLMNLRSRGLYVDLSFYLDSRDSKQYRFVVKGKRSSKHFEQVKYERQSYQWENDQWIPVSFETAEELLGLSYENFRRTVIIPQGRFREFIELKDTARSKMLNDIFGLERFMFSYQTKSLINKNNTEIAQKEAILQRFDKLTQEHLDKTKLEIEEMLHALEKIKNIHQERVNIRESQDRLKQWVEEVGKLETKLFELDQDKGSITQREKQLQEYIQCLNIFRDPLNRKIELSQELKEIHHTLRQEQDTIDKLSQEITKSKQSFKEIESNFQARHKLKEKAEEFSRIIELKIQEESIGHLKKRMENGKNKLVEKQEQKAQERREISELEKLIAEVKSSLPDPQQLMHMREWWNKQQYLLTKKKEAESFLEECKDEIHSAIQHKRKLISNTFLDVRQYDLPTTQIVSLIQKEIERLQAKSKAIEDHLQRAQVSRQLESLAKNLTVGAPCPLCGSTEHPLPLHISDNDNEITELQSGQEEVQSQLIQLERVIPLLGELIKQADILKKKKKNGEEKLASSVRELEEHRATWNMGESLITLEEIQQLLDIYQSRKDQMDQNETRIVALRNDLEEVEKTLSTYQQVLENIQQEYSEKLGHYQSQKASLKQIIYDDQRKMSDEDLREQALKMEKDYEQIGVLYQDIAQQIEDLKGRLKAHEGKRDVMQDSYRNTTQKLARINQELDKELADSTFDSFTYIQEILSLNLNIDAERNTLDQFKRNFTEAQTQLTEIKKQIGDQHFDAEVYNTLVEEITQLRENIRQEEQRIGAKKIMLKKEQSEWEEKQQLLKELEALHIREENLKTMSNLFRGDGFVKFVSSAYLENLCISANERFMRLTHNALSLEIDEQNQFQVLDRLHEGRIRSIRTLSGGQTFQAALCLALALADQVRQQANAEQNFFFLDEGFGALDKESLRLIFLTLQSLRKENRIVGVISHVEELQQEIETFLHIHNDPELGSQVQMSWE